MGKVIIGVIALLLAIIGGAMFGGAIIGGTAAGVGVATGLSAGICSTVTAAEEEGLLTPEQVDQILSRAAADLAEMSGETSPGDVVGTIAECESVMERLRSASN